MGKHYPEPTVGCFILNGKNELLLTKQPKWHNIYTICGGHIGLGETIADACRREAMEETGLKVEFKEIFLIHDAIFPKKFHKKKHFIFIECMCRALTSRVRLDRKEAFDFKWINPRKYKEAGIEIDEYTAETIKYFNSTYSKGRRHANV